MNDSSTDFDLFAAVSRQFSPDNIVRTVEYFNTLPRYTGTLEGEAAANHIMEKMNQYGVDARRYTYDAYLSRPLSASIRLGSERFDAIAAVYSGEANHLRGELVYLKDSNSLARHGKLDKKSIHLVSGKIILVHEVEPGFAKLARDARALAVIQIQKSKEELIHHSTIGTVWGTPSLADIDSFPYIPYVTVTHSTGEELVSRAATGNANIELMVSMDNSIKTSTMPVARIKGKSDKFVLVSAHYDSWYEGITDNAVSDAILMEYARVFSQYRDKLDRSIVIGWWSGHSDGRYAGSTWYCDNFWKELSENCVAHINIDLAGCKNADQIRARTTLMEGPSFTADLILKYTGNVAKPSIPMIRGADQSFWGAKIPISIMLKYEPLPENCDFQCPSGGVWWHTDHDTLDKLDDKIMVRDMLINAEMICSIVNCGHLPIDIPGFIEGIASTLGQLAVAQSDIELLRPVYEELRILREKIEALSNSREFVSTDNDDVLKRIGGELVRLAYSYSSPYYHDSAFSTNPFPLLRKSFSILRDSNESDLRLFALTDIVRQRNRLVGEIENLVMIADYTLLRLSNTTFYSPFKTGSGIDV